MHTKLESYPVDEVKSKSRDRKMKGKFIRRNILCNAIPADVVKRVEFIRNNRSKGSDARPIL